MYNEEDWARYHSSPDAAQELLDRSWSMSLGVYELLGMAFDLDNDSADRLCRVLQNLLIGRLNDLNALLVLIEQGTGLTSEKSKKVAAAIATTILIPFNTLVKC